MHDSSHQAGDVPLVLFLHVDGQHLHTLLLHLGHLENVVLNKMIINLGLLINVFRKQSDNFFATSSMERSTQESI